MLRTIWDTISSLRPTLWLLVSCVALFLIGGVYATNNYEFIDAMNSMPLQVWMTGRALARPMITWWIYPLILCLFLLAVNTFCCSVRRIAQIWNLRKSMSRKIFSLRMAPSLVHCFFLLILFGHLLTTSMGAWERHPIAEGGELALGDGTILTVSYITSTYYSDDTLLAGRISQTAVMLKDRAGAEISLAYLNPVSYGPYYLFLNMTKDKKRGAAPAITVQPTVHGKENCNKELDYVNDKKGEQKLYIMAIKDHGLGLVVTGFVFILAIMIWYFIELNRAEKTE